MPLDVKAAHALYLSGVDEWKDKLPPWASVDEKYKSYIVVDADVVFPLYAELLGYDLDNLTFEKIEVMYYCYLADIKKVVPPPRFVKELPGKERRRWDRRRYPHEPPISWRDEYARIPAHTVEEAVRTYRKPRRWKRKK